MKVLNLYAGLGGNRKRWSGHSITAVEHQKNIAEVYKHHFPDDEIIIADAHEFLLHNFCEFDFIWSSPPCQSHSRLIRSGRNRKPRYPDLRLYEEIIFLKANFKGLWVVENVIPYYEQLMPAKQFGRHLIWSNFYIPNFSADKLPVNWASKSSHTVNELKAALGFSYLGNIYYGKNKCPVQVLRNCVHPALGEHILNSAINSTTTLSYTQHELFKAKQ